MHLQSYVTVKTCPAQPDFSFDVLAASVFKIDCEDVEIAGKGGLLIERVFDSMELVLSRRLYLQVHQLIEHGDILAFEVEKREHEENECPKEAFYHSALSNWTLPSRLLMNQR